MKTRYMIATLAGGVAAFIWSSISWMAIPWHQPTMRVFEEEANVAQAIKEAASAPGIYTYPGWTDDAEDMERKHQEGPYVFAAVVPSGVGSKMAGMMIGGLVVNVIGAALLLALMLQVEDPGWKRRMRIGLLAALFVSLVPALMSWNWWHFSAGFTGVGIVDNWIGWSLAGFVIAKVIARQQPTIGARLPGAT